MYDDRASGTSSGWKANIESIDVTSTHPLSGILFHLDYSYDGGITWKRLLEKNDSPEGHYDWPAQRSTNSSMTDTENGQVVDQSDL